MRKTVSHAMVGYSFAPFQPRVARLKWRYRIHVIQMATAIQKRRTDICPPECYAMVIDQPNI
jgi:hypothetical protein